jgi:hypothetical protein
MGRVLGAVFDPYFPLIYFFSLKNTTESPKQGAKSPNSNILWNNSALETLKSVPKYHFDLFFSKVLNTFRQFLPKMPFFAQLSAQNIKCSTE